MRLRDALRHDHGGPSFAGLEPDATPKAPGGKRRTLAKLEERGVELAGLQERLYAEATQPGATRRVLLVLQGMDTSGKGGTIKHVIGLVNPQGVAIASFKKPTEEELRHHFLWRVRHRAPAPGMLGIFDRSHYEDVLVARVHHLADRSTIERRYEEINRFEAKLAQEGVAIVKVFLHLSFEEQRERLLARLRAPEKHWKFNPADVEERQRWPDYQRAYDLALERCSTEHAPWYVVPADHKWYRNWAVGRLLLETLRELDPQYPQPDLDVEELERGLRHDGVVVAEAARA
jgi:PPK2 family polyphosphate:nucleotide phosphotransferase